MEKSLRAISLSHERADVEIRELIGFTETQLESFYSSLQDVFGLSEAMLLSTCNRLELYYFCSKNLNDDLIKFLCVQKSLPSENYKGYFISFHDLSAHIHLYSVAMGLKSQVLGDLEIYGQVKVAYKMSADQGMAGPLLNRTMHGIFSCHKKVNQKTSLQHGAASISYNAVHVLEKHLQTSKSTPVLVIGAGKMGRDVCSHLKKRKFLDVSVTNRTDKRAYEIAQLNGFSFVRYDNHRELMKRTPIVISAISCDTNLYGLTDFLETNTQFIVDISSPRAFHPEVGKKGVQIFNIDDLGGLVNDVMRIRQREVPAVQKEIERTIQEFFDWQNNVEMSNQLRSFKEALEEMRRQTLSGMLKRMDAEEKALAEEVTLKMMQKIISLPAIQIRTACSRDNAKSLSANLIELFDLDMMKIKVKTINKG
ncbi:MAG: glutamyl-tRNA reductase [Bacteroidota bacterium]